VSRPLGVPLCVLRRRGRRSAKRADGMFPSGRGPRVRAPAPAFPDARPAPAGSRAPARYRAPGLCRSRAPSPVSPSIIWSSIGARIIERNRRRQRARPCLPGAAATSATSSSVRRCGHLARGGITRYGARVRSPLRAALHRDLYQLVYRWSARPVMAVRRADQLAQVWQRG
jgi:hypothetical protein